MIRVFLILFFGLSCEAIGFALMGRGLRSLGDLTPFSFARIFGVVKKAAANPWLWLGMVFQTTFFGTLLVLIAQRDISFILPLTALGMIFTTLAARLLLHERVTALRWVGVILIAFGASLVTVSEQSKKPETSVAPAGNGPAGSAARSRNTEHSTSSIERSRNAAGAASSIGSWTLKVEWSPVAADYRHLDCRPRAL